jgi:hypothetical protein
MIYAWFVKYGKEDDGFLFPTLLRSSIYAFGAVSKSVTKSIRRGISVPSSTDPECLCRFQQAMGKLSVEANIGWIDVRVTLSHLWKGHLVALEYKKGNFGAKFYWSRVFMQVSTACILQWSLKIEVMFSVEANIGWIDVRVTLSHLWKGHLVALEYSSKLPHLGQFPKVWLSP